MSAILSAPQVYAFVREAIQDGRLQSGHGLPGEHDPADAIGVSYRTVRTALSALRQDGLTEPETWIGSFVKAPE